MYSYFQKWACYRWRGSLSAFKNTHSLVVSSRETTQGEMERRGGAGGIWCKYVKMWCICQAAKIKERWKRKTVRLIFKLVKLLIWIWFSQLRNPPFSCLMIVAMPHTAYLLLVYLTAVHFNASTLIVWCTNFDCALPLCNYQKWLFFNNLHFFTFYYSSNSKLQTDGKGSMDDILPDINQARTTIAMPV